MSVESRPVELVPPSSRPVLNDKAARVLVEILMTARKRAEEDASAGSALQGVKKGDLTER